MIASNKNIRNEGYRVLRRELGVAGATQFLRELDVGRGNYTEERDDIVNENSVDIIADRIRTRNAQTVKY